MEIKFNYSDMREALQEAVRIIDMARELSDFASTKQLSYTDLHSSAVVWLRKYVDSESLEEYLSELDSQEMVLTPVGYISRKAWDEHAKRIAEENDQSKVV